jgi:hypothetical protein
MEQKNTYNIGIYLIHNGVVLSQNYRTSDTIEAEALYDELAQALIEHEADAKVAYPTQEE